MSKGILEFDLPEEREEFERAVKAEDWYLAAWDLMAWLRSRIKYSTDPSSTQVLETVRKAFLDGLEDRNLSME